MLKFEGVPLNIPLRNGGALFSERIFISEDVLRDFGYNLHEWNFDQKFKIYKNTDFDLPVYLDFYPVPGGVECVLEADTRCFPVLSSFDKPFEMRIRLQFYAKDSTELGEPLPLFTFRGEPLGEAPVEAALVIDLGNTRSFCLVVDDITSLGSNEVIGLYRPHMNPDALTGAERDSGVFDSFTVLEHPARFGGRGFLEKLSFARVGSKALRLQRDIIEDYSMVGRYSLSSPKRYFWQSDPEQGAWKAAPSNHDAETISVKPGGPFLETLLNEFTREEIETEARRLNRDGARIPLDNLLNQDRMEQLSRELGIRRIAPEKMPRSAVLAGFIAEIFEQTEGFLNSPEFINSTRIKRPRTITRVCVTYPSGWAKSEIAEYRERLEMGLRSFAELRNRTVPVLDVSCDEAGAAMLCYIYSEIIKFGGSADTFLRTYGRSGRPGQPPTARLAVIDIGGGTSDLVIAEACGTGDSSGGRVDVITLYQHGFNRAGDELLRNVIEGVVLPVLGEAFFFSNPELRRAMFADLLGGAGTVAADLRVTWARTLWFHLAINVIQNAANGKFEVSLEDNPNVAYGFKSFQDTCKQWAIDHGHGEFFNDTPLTKIELPHNANSKIMQLTRTSFSQIIRNFSAACSAFNCDMVLLAGKTTEYPQVFELFRENIPLPDSKFISLKDYRTGPWCSMTARGRIDDIKVTTALGAALKTLSDMNSPLLNNLRLSLKLAPGIDERNHYWGQVARGRRRFGNNKAVFTPANDTAVIAMAGNSYILGRRRFGLEHQDAYPACELRVKPKYSGFGSIVDTAAVTVAKRTAADGSVSLEIIDASGDFADGSELKKEHLEIRHRTSFEDDQWIDSGCILSRDWTLKN